jgi:hypothetical protein
VAGLFVASASFAGVPSPGNSTVPGCVPVVGSLLGTVDPAGAITITVRDLANNPLNGASVVLDFSGTADVAICSDQLDAGALVNCAAKTTRKFTNALGQVSFTVIGGSNGSGNASSLMNAGRIYANGVPIGSPTVSAYDLDGANGVAINDLSAWPDGLRFGHPVRPFGLRLLGLGQHQRPLALADAVRQLGLAGVVRHRLPVIS